MNDPYKVLNVSPSASDEEVKKAYRDLARKYHPDNYHDNPLADLAQEKMKEINEAYDTITKMRSGGYRGGKTVREKSRTEQKSRRLKQKPLPERKKSRIRPQSQTHPKLLMRSVQQNVHRTPEKRKRYLFPVIPFNSSDRILYRSLHIPFPPSIFILLFLRRFFVVIACRNLSAFPQILVPPRIFSRKSVTLLNFNTHTLRFFRRKSSVFGDY